MLRVAIVGCGKIADIHASQIQRIPESRIVAVCDSEILMARQLAERFAVSHVFTDLRELLVEAKPQVVHITTPPESHFKLAEICLEWGSHVYVEKPFTLNHSDAERLIALGQEKGLKLTVGHDGQFGHAARRMRSLVQSAYLGEHPVHIEGYYCYELGDSAYVRALLADKQHWVRQLPGKLLHNIISHGIAGIAEFLTSDCPQIIAHGFRSPFLASMGEDEILDELRVIINDKNHTTAYFTFSSQIRPALHQLRLYGSRNGLVLDYDQETLVKLRGAKFKSYVEKFVPPITLSRQYIANWQTNVLKFLRRDFHTSAGMHCLIQEFYRSIEEGTAVPISYREILRTAKIMDAIFSQLPVKQLPSKTERSVVLS